MYIIICEIDNQSQFNAGCSKPVHWDNPDEWDGEGGGGGGLEQGDTCTPVADSCQRAKTHHDIIKQLASN